jgi:hypothetical protein
MHIATHAHNSSAEVSNHWDSKAFLDVEVEVQILANTIFSLTYLFVWFFQWSQKSDAKICFNINTSHIFWQIIIKFQANFWFRLMCSFDSLSLGWQVGFHWHSFTFCFFPATGVEILHSLSHESLLLSSLLSPAVMSLLELSLLSLLISKSSSLSLLSSASTCVQDKLLCRAIPELLHWC